MSRFFYTVIFLLKNYNRKTRLLSEGLLLAVFIGIIFNPNYAPYSDEYVILASNIFFLIFAIAIGYRFMSVQYRAQLSILLNRVSRVMYYLASMVSCLLITIFGLFVLDLFLILFVQTESALLLSYDLLCGIILNMLLAFGISHLFSPYIMRDYLIRFATLIIVGLGALPQWYKALPGETILKVIANVFPPLGLNINQMLDMSLSIPMIIYSLIYISLIVGAGVYLFTKRSLNDLYY